MSFFGNYVVANVWALHDGIVKTIADFDPQGASEAQLAEYGDKVHEMEGLAAKAEIQAQADAAQVAKLTASAEQHVNASALVEKQVTAETDPAAKARKQATLDKLNADATAILGDLESAHAAAKDSRGYADGLLAAHKQAVAKWTAGRSNLERAKREQDRARLDAARAQERKADAKRAAGLTTRIDTSDIVLNAMAANTAKYEQQAKGARLTTGELKSATAGDSDVAEALSAVSDAPAASATTAASLAERLAALKG